MPDEPNPAPLAVREAAQSAAAAMIPRSMTEALTFGKFIATSDLVPNEYRGRPDNCALAIMAGARFGLDPFQALNSIAIINGRPSMWGDAVLAIVKASGVLDPDFGAGGVEERDPAASLAAGEGRCEVKRRGEKGTTVRTFSMADAETAGLLERARDKGKGRGTWLTYPGRMLQMRARSWALRDSCGEILKGLRVREEEEDIPRDAEGVTVSRPRRASEIATAPALTDQEVKDFQRETGASRPTPAAPPRQAAPAASPAEPLSWTGTIRDVASKSGTGAKGKAWTLYRVQAEGIEFSTFSDTDAETARTLKGARARVEYEDKPDSKGNVHHSITKIGAAPPADEPAADAPRDFGF